MKVGVEMLLFMGWFLSTVGNYVKYLAYYKMSLLPYSINDRSAYHDLLNFSLF